MFLNRLSGPPIGLTALGMFVVDKSMVLTVSYTRHIDTLFNKSIIWKMVVRRVYSEWPNENYLAKL